MKKTEFEAQEAKIASMDQYFDWIQQVLDHCRNGGLRSESGIMQIQWLLNDLKEEGIRP